MLLWGPLPSSWYLPAAFRLPSTPWHATVKAHLLASSLCDRSMLNRKSTAAYVQEGDGESVGEERG